ncbi:MAG: hypothetical protein JRG71_04845 [Deltaproteobacteria bacterium]|nr:hypothetical protein [Deltaproteobacteria bacterium]
MEKNRWIEIVSVRLCDPTNKEAVQAVFDQVNPQLSEREELDGCAELYLNAQNESDWSIHLYWKAQVQVPSKTLLGIGIAEVFNSLGLVNHSIWQKGYSVQNYDKKSSPH